VVYGNRKLKNLQGRREKQDAHSHLACRTLTRRSLPPDLGCLLARARLGNLKEGGAVEMAIEAALPDLLVDSIHPASLEVKNNLR